MSYGPGADPLEALESLVEKWRRLGAMPVGETAPNPMFTRHADELEPIIQQLLTERDELRRSRDAASALAASFRFSEREWRDKAQDKIAEVEKLEEEREVLGEHVKAHAMHARSLSDALSLTGAEVESLRAEREELVEAGREVADVYSAQFDWDEPSAAGDAIRRFRAALEASSPKDGSRPSTG